MVGVSAFSTQKPAVTHGFVNNHQFRHEIYPDRMLATQGASGFTAVLAAFSSAKLFFDQTDFRAANKVRHIFNGWETRNFSTVRHYERNPGHRRVLMYPLTPSP